MKPFTSKDIATDLVSARKHVSTNPVGCAIASKVNSAWRDVAAFAADAFGVACIFAALVLFLAVTP